MGIHTAKLDTGCSENYTHSLYAEGNSPSSNHSETMFDREESH